MNSATGGTYFKPKKVGLFCLSLAACHCALGKFGVECEPVSFGIHRAMSVLLALTWAQNLLHVSQGLVVHELLILKPQFLLGQCLAYIGKI